MSDPYNDPSTTSIQGQTDVRDVRTDEEGTNDAANPQVSDAHEPGTRRRILIHNAKQALAASRARCCVHGVQRDHCHAEHPEETTP